MPRSNTVSLLGGVVGLRSAASRRAFLVVAAAASVGVAVAIRQHNLGQAVAARHQS